MSRFNHADFGLNTQVQNVLTPHNIRLSVNFFLLFDIGIELQLIIVYLETVSLAQ